MTRVASAVVALLALACANSPPLPTVEELDRYASESTREYVIGPGDELSISVWQQVNLTVPMLSVRLDGKISFPLLDDVQAAGLTTNELKQTLTERLSEYIVHPTVTVLVRKSNSKLIYVMGEVARVGPIMYRGDMRVVDALSTAGGFRPFADKHEVKVIRHINGSEPLEFLFDYPRYASGDDLSQNILLLPGDRIVVPEQAPFWR